MASKIAEKAGSTAEAFVSKVDDVAEVAAEEADDVARAAEKADDITNAAEKYTGDRTEAELEALAKDPAHTGSKRAVDIAKEQHEAEVGLDLEKKGLLKDIIRDETGKAEFIESTGTKWDIKGFNSNFTPKKGGFKLDKAMGLIEDSLAVGRNKKWI